MVYGGMTNTSLILCKVAIRSERSGIDLPTFAGGTKQSRLSPRYLVELYEEVEHIMVSSCPNR